MKRSESKTSPDSPPSSKRSKNSSEIRPPDLSENSHGQEINLSHSAGTDGLSHPIEMESLVGITAFANPTLPPIHGVIKSRFSDFHVNELDLEGNTVELTELDTRTADEQEEAASSNPENTASQLDELSDEQLVSKLKDLIPDNIIPNLEYLNENTSSDSIPIPPIQDKESRKSIHFIIKSLYPNLSTSAKDKEITVQHVDHVEYSLTRSVGWPKKLPTFCRCVLFKENIDTLQAISTLATKLHIKPNSIGYAGIKDKRAKTTQLLTFRRFKAKRLIGLNKVRAQIKLGNFRYVDKAIRLGDLTGNKFRIVLRSVTTRESDVSLAIESMKTSGFVNYFGLQRFGNRGGETHLVGRLILQQRWEGAVLMLVGGERAGEDEATAAARAVFRSTLNAELALEAMPRYRCNEVALLKALAAQGKSHNWLNALQKVPLQTRKLYAHAYQSYLWNKSVSFRLAKAEERKLMVGDSVLSGDGTVVTMDEECVDSDQFSFQDLVIPTLGEDSPDEFSLQLLREDNITFSDIKSLQREYQLHTNFRAVFVKPKFVEWRLEKYSSLEDALIESDLEKLIRIQNEECECSRCEVVEGKTALMLSFHLPKSCYATMALRELIRQDTSSTYQATLNAI